MNINERTITFSPKSARLPIPLSLDLRRGEDVDIIIKDHHFIYNVVSLQEFENQDGTYNVNYILKSTLE